jgi:hypothetical protein
LVALVAVVVEPFLLSFALDAALGVLVCRGFGEIDLDDDEVEKAPPLEVCITTIASPSGSSPPSSSS